jgi:hypothetical protein
VFAARVGQVKPRTIESRGVDLVRQLLRAQTDSGESPIRCSLREFESTFAVAEFFR